VGSWKGWRFGQLNDGFVSGMNLWDLERAERQSGMLTRLELGGASGVLGEHLRPSRHEGVDQRHAVGLSDSVEPGESGDNACAISYY